MTRQLEKSPVCVTCSRLKITFSSYNQMAPFLRHRSLCIHVIANHSIIKTTLIEKQLVRVGLFDVLELTKRFQQATP